MENGHFYKSVGLLEVGLKKGFWPKNGSFLAKLEGIWWAEFWLKKGQNLGMVLTFWTKWAKNGPFYQTWKIGSFWSKMVKNLACLSAFLTVG